MKRGTPDHPKVLMLANRLKIPRYAAVGLLECLWHFTARYAAQGDVGRFENDIIASALDWKKKPDDLISALIAEKWLDVHEKYRLVVHHWSDHSDDTANTYLLRSNLPYCDGKQARQRYKKDKKEDECPSTDGKCPEPAGTIPDGAGKSPSPAGKCADTQNHNQNHNQNHTHNQEPGTGGGDVLNPDEAHKILKERPELSLLTWEQDMTARKDVKGMEMYGGAKLNFVEAAKWITREAVIAGPRDVPGYWLRKQYQTYFTKKSATVSDPSTRVFVSERPKDAPRIADIVKEK